MENFMRRTNLDFVDEGILSELLTGGFNLVGHFKEKDLVLVIGNTGAGKSTMINYLLGCPMKREEGRVRVQEGYPEFAKIGLDKCYSATLYPEAYAAVEGHSFCDVAGWGDSRDPKFKKEFQITTAICTKIAINSAKLIKSIIVVVDQESLVAGRAASLSSVFNALENFFHSSGINNLSSSVIFAITKIKYKRMNYLRYFEKMRTEATGDPRKIFLCDVALSSKIIEVDPLDQGLSKQVLEAAIRHSAPLLPGDFGFTGDADTERVFREFIAVVAEEGNEILDGFLNLPAKIARKWADKNAEQENFNAINAQYNQIASRFLNGDCERVRYFIAELEKIHKVIQEKKRNIAIVETAIQKNEKRQKDIILEKNKTIDLYNSLIPRYKQRCNRYEYSFNNYGGDHPQTRQRENEMLALDRELDGYKEDVECFNGRLSQFEGEVESFKARIAAIANDIKSNDRPAVASLESKIHYYRNEEIKKQEEHRRGELIEIEKVKSISFEKLNKLIEEFNREAFAFEMLKEKFLINSSLFLLLFKISAVIGENFSPVLTGFLRKFNPFVFQQLSRANDALAQTCLGFCYENGLGLMKNSEKAVSFYQAAASQNEKFALYQLACCYARGIGVKPSDTMAIKHFHFSARLGHKKAQQGHEAIFKKILSSAQQSHPASQSALAFCFLHGYGVEKNVEMAKKYNEEAANKNDPEGAFNLATFYELGIGVDKNIVLALQYYSLAKTNGHADAATSMENLIRQLHSFAKNKEAWAAYCLGVCYAHGLAVKQDHSNAVHFYTIAKENNHILAHYELAFYYEKGEVVKKDLLVALRLHQRVANHHEKAKERLTYLVELLKLGSQRKDPLSQYCLATCYLENLGVTQNIYKAAQYYGLAKRGAFPLDDFCMGLCSEFGEGVKQDSLQALRYYKHALDSGNTEAKTRINAVLHDLDLQAKRNSSAAQFTLGKYYAEILGEAKNDAEAITYFKLSAEQNHPLALHELGIFYQEGRAVPQNKIQSLRFFNQATKLGNEESQNRAGILLAHLIELAEEGDAEAQCQSGLCYEESLGGLEHNYEMALTYYQRAAKQKYPQAFFHLARCYEEGKGCERNESLAIKFYKLASTHHSGEASFVLGNYYSGGTLGLRKNYRRASLFYRSAIQEGHPNAREAFEACEQERQQHKCAVM